MLHKYVSGVNKAYPEGRFRNFSLDMYRRMRYICITQEEQ